MEWRKDKYLISDDQSRADIDFIFKALSTTYWAPDRPREVVEKSIRNSVLLSLYAGSKPIGFLRIVSDGAVFAWLCDFYVDPLFRGQDLGKWMFTCCLEHPAARVKMNLLATRDAHGLYERYGFEPFECMRRNTKQY